MSCLQKTMVVKLEDMEQSNLIFFGKPVMTSWKFATKRLRKFRKNKKRRLVNKWMNRYGFELIPRADAEIYSQFILCHPSCLWRFEINQYIDELEPETKEVCDDIHL